MGYKYINTKEKLRNDLINKNENRIKRIIYLIEKRNLKKRTPYRIGIL
jgi:hypothetical protein